MNSFALTESLKAEAVRLGFELAAACPAVQPNTYSSFLRWLDSGFHGEMEYLHRRKQAYQHPDHVFSGAVSVLMLGMNYQTQAPNRPASGFGRVSRYAWSDIDYHDLIREKLNSLVNFCQSLSHPIRARGVVDSAPLLEREFAQLAGLGWQAKNTMLINQQMGSWFFLAALVLDSPLQYDEPSAASHCGTCTACLQACPTQAFVQPLVLDATKCISYLTIEHRSSIPIPLREKMGEWLFGCDICQDVCPWNRKAPITPKAEFAPSPGRNPVRLWDMFEMDESDFRQTFRNTPLWRPRRRGLLRNAAIVLGNSPVDENIPYLAQGLNDPEELVRGASAWALGKHRSTIVIPILELRLAKEDCGEVVEEIQAALNRLANDNCD